MTWDVYLSYRRARPANQGGHGAEHGELHRFETRADAVDFARRANATTGWAPAGAYDLDVSDPIHNVDHRSKGDAA